MTITITYQGLILTILAVLGMILLVYLILLLRKLIGTLREVDKILSDAKIVSGIASDKAQMVDGIIDDAGEAVGSITDGEHVFLRHRTDKGKIRKRRQQKRFVQKEIFRKERK